MKNMITELLSPAGSYESFEAAIGAGADAVYVGGPAFGARAYAQNFTQEELITAIETAHIHNRKLYLTVNTLLKNRELDDQLFEYLLPYYEAGLDAVIVQDLGVFSFIRRNFPDLDIHASTQMTVTGPEGMRFLEEKGATRVVPARELSLEEISAMHKASPLEIETFIHGALCYSYSGQCLMSSIFGGRSGNRGRCAQPCRLPYSVTMDHRKYKGDKDFCALSLKDICTLDILPDILEAGVMSLKIEGRMKQPAYTAGVTAVYRKYLDMYLSGKEYHVQEKDRKYLLELFSRGGSCKGYYDMYRGPEMMAFANEKKSGNIQPEIRKIKEKISFTTEKYRKEADRKITESVLELNEYKSADCVFCYVSTEKEMDTFSILQDILQSGKHLGVPKCTGKGIMNVYEIHSLQELYPGAYGILEPKEDPERLIQPEAIDFAFIPCISCDRSGRRLGHGGGYYDRYLEKTHCVKAALCREELLVDEIPVEEHDLRMDFVISEKGCYKM